MRIFVLFLSLIMLGQGSAFAKTKVVASFSILADMVQEVAGDNAEVTSIVGPDADASLHAKGG